MIDALINALFLTIGGGLVGFGVWLGYRMGYQAQTGLTPSPITEPEYGGVSLEYADPRDYDDAG